MCDMESTWKEVFYEATKPGFLITYTKEVMLLPGLFVCQPDTEKVAVTIFWKGLQLCHKTTDQIL